MVAISITLVTTTISTIIVVTMATIFFCCWRKKGSGNIAPDKTSSSKEEFKKERSASPTNNLGRSENGVLAGTQRVPALAVSNEEDLGDFSAVQRETEILRSYRKPPPPKNRARQSRAPRALKSGTESLDIFTELSEGDGKVEYNLHKETKSPNDDVDSSPLHGHSEEKENLNRDTRSSMLAEIEQTLAALHMSEQSTAPSSGDASFSEDKMIAEESFTQDADDKSRNDGKSLSQQKLQTELRLGQTVASNEVNTESASTIMTLSSRTSPVIRSKHGPKVSPKPSPRNSAYLTSRDSASVASAALKKHSAASETDTLKLITDSNMDVGSMDLASSQSPDPQIKSESTDKRIQIEGSASNQHPVSLDNITGNSIHSQTLSNAEPDVQSGSADTDVIIQDDEKSNKTVMSKPETATKAEENDITETRREEDNVTGTSKITAMKSSHATEQPEDNIPLSNGEKATELVNGKGSESPPCSQILLRDINSEPSSPTKEIAALLVKGTKEPASPDRGNSSILPEGDSKVASEENGKQRRESTEDQSGKGKISKIPVRAGSKPRTSPPKQPTGEKATSSAKQ